jgi:predicted branched-subunit amino acid permease
VRTIARAGLRALAAPQFRAGFVEMLPACVGLVPFGLVTGIGAASAGADWLAALGMSAIMFSGAAQVLAAQLFAAGAPLGVIILTCFVAGLRFMMYSAAMAPHLRALSPRWQGAVAFLLTDQAFAVAVRRFDMAGHPREGALYALGAGMALYVSWQVTNLVGFAAGASIPASWSLDFAVPLCFLALLAPALRTAPALVAALVAGVAVLELQDLPMRLNLVAAGLLGIAAGTLAEIGRERWTRR